jgi:hypothetical protein
MATLRGGGGMISWARVMPRRGTALLATLMLPLVAIGLVSFTFIRSQQGDGDTLALRQHQAQSLTATAVARAVRGAPDPIGNEKAAAAQCKPLGTGELHNPWLCGLIYPTGRQLQYHVSVEPDGSYFGDDQVVIDPPPPHPQPGTIRGCCIPVP